MPAPRRETRLGAFTPEGIAQPPRSDEPAARTVSEVVGDIQRAIVRDPALSNVWVRGQVSGAKAPGPSGHLYFALKDEMALLNVVMWRDEAQRLKFELQEGMEVLARGRINMFAGRGAVQLYVDEVRPVGAGELQLRFEQLRRKLDAEGLFSTSRKRPIPRFPRTVGIVTSLQAAALRDMVHVATARHPGVRLLVADTRVQGPGAAVEIALAIMRMNRRTDVDVIIVGRGGGSTEDLWAFNEEPVVRAVVASRIPVVSAVGHEVDYTLCDFAADMRAATPSNACELVVPDAKTLHRAIHDAEARMGAALVRIVPEMRQRLDLLQQRAIDGVRRTIAKERELMAAHAARLDALSPLAVLARGYAVVKKGDKALRRAAEAAEGDDVHITLQDGSVDAKITQRRLPDG